MVKLKDTPIGKIPEDWEVAKLKDIVSYTKGKKPNRLYESKKEDYFVPYLTAENMRDAKNVKWCNPNDKNVVLVKEDEIILIWDGSNAGDVFMGFNGALASTMIKITPKNKNDIISRYFYYQLERLSKKCLKTTTVGTGIPHINKKVFENIIIPLPPLEEQKKIAEILSTVDKAIEKVDEAIARTERLKKGLMQELLTKGIGHKEFKDTEIGRIPKEWNVVKFKEIMIGSPQSGLYKSKDFYDGNGVKIIRMTELFKGDILRIEEDMKRVNVSNNELSKYSLNPGDLLFARRSLKIEGSGRCVLVPELNEPIVFESSILRVKLNRNITYPLFYLYYLNSDQGRKQISKMIRTVAVSGITGKDLQNISVPLPPLEEQQKIAEILTTVDKKLELERKRKEKLERIKKGLMNDLLTGKVRVKI